MSKAFNVCLEEKIMKWQIKLIAWILCLVMMLQIPIVTYATDHAETTEYVIPLASNILGKQKVLLLERDGRYYLSVEDIGRLTRCQLQILENEILLDHGLRQIVIDKKTCKAEDHILGIAQDQNIERELPVAMITHEDGYYFEAVPMLMYMGATCSIVDDGALNIWMPPFTIYESILEGYWNWKVDLESLYGGQENIDDAIACAVWSDLFDFVNGEGIQTNFDIHIENAMYEILAVDVLKYNSAQTLAAQVMEELNGFLEVCAEEHTSAVPFLLEQYLNAQESQINHGALLCQINGKAGDTDEVARISKELNQQLYEHLETKRAFDEIGSFLDASTLALDIAVTSHTLMQYDDSTKKLFANTINDRILSAAHCSTKYKNVTDQIAENLSSDGEIIGSTAVDKIKEYFWDAVEEKGFKAVIKQFTSGADLYAAAVEIGGTIASLFNYKRNEAFSADLNAIILGRYQEELSYLLKYYYHYACGDGASLNDETFEDLRNLLILYYRTTIAFEENYTASVEYFDKKNGKERAEASRSIADRFAEYLYRITNCKMVPLADRADLEQDLIKPEWIEKVSASVAVDFEKLVSDAAVETVFVDDDWCYCYHIPQFNLPGDQAQQINRKMADHCDDLLDQYVYPSVRDYGYAEIEQMIYDWGYHRDLASVVLESTHMWGGAEYDVYTISISTGQEVAVDTLLAVYGLDLEGFHELVHARLRQYWDERSDWRENTGAEFFDDRVDRTLSDENIRSAVPYINSEGGLSFVANIYSLAGGDSYYHRINAKGPIEAESMECTKEHRSDSSSKDDPLQYFIENCSSRYFEKEEIQGFDLQMCLYARNAVFARAGRKFQNEELRTYFEQYSWYQPHIAAEDFQDSMLSAIELANVNLILEHEKALKVDAQIPSSVQTTEQALQAYGDVLDMFHAGVSTGWTNRDGEGWGVPRDPDDVSYLFYAYLSDYTPAQIGYAFLDLNGDDNLELLVAPMDLQDKGEFYELYTVAGGKLVHAISAGERDMYYAAVDGSINNHGSGSALTSSDDNLRLDPADGSLKVNQAVIHDAYRDKLNPYFYAETDYYDPKTYETDYSVLKPISEEEAKQIKDAFPDNRVIAWVPFAQYTGR